MKKRSGDEVLEEYLECIYKLEEKFKVARTSEIVKSLELSPGTVTNTLRRLRRMGYIIHRPYRGVRLTEKGRKIAIDVIRKHRLSERLLTDLLKLEWEKSHNAACRLEHSISEEIARLLDEALNHPKTCPHGNPIPTESGKVFDESCLPLSSLKAGIQCEVVKVTDESVQLLQYLKSVGLVPGALVEILNIEPFDGPITIRVGTRQQALNRKVASLIQVKQR
ncbi:MAG: metal-dependent transcriptional regulator [Nitrososphaerota archaeon]